MFELDGKQLDEHELFNEYLDAAAYAIRSTYHTTHEASPGQLVFGRDMILPHRFLADWALIAKRKQDTINVSNKRENSKRVPHQYQLDDEVLLTKPGIIRKLEAPRTGPYRITEVNDNGTVRIRKGPVEQTINIRGLLPFKRP